MLSLMILSLPSLEAPKNIFLVGYLYLYIRSIQGKFATIPGMEWLTDSVAFWLRIKTPTMRFGKGKEKK